jgi:hypothetical protein
MSPKILWMTYSLMRMSRAQVQMGSWFWVGGRKDCINFWTRGPGSLKRRGLNDSHVLSCLVSNHNIPVH